MTKTKAVDKLFHAMADPTRREIVQILSDEGKQSASMIYERFNMSEPAISQHLKVLRDARLVNVEKKAKYRLYAVNKAAILEIENWTANVKRMLEENFRSLDDILRAQKQKEENGVEKNGK